MAAPNFNFDSVITWHAVSDSEIRRSVSERALRSGLKASSLKLQGLKDDANKQNRRLLKLTIPSLLKLHPTLIEFLLDLLPLHWQKLKHLENYLEWVFKKYF